MSNGLMLLDTTAPLQLPAHLAGQNLGVTANLLATVGAGGNRIGLKGSRFRLVINGKEEGVREENYLDVIIVGVVPHISRMYYEGEYEAGAKKPPTCFSEDGVAPPLDLGTKVYDKCDKCPMNEKGSKIANGVKMKACGFFQRLVVMLAGDDSGTYYKLDVKSQGIFGEGQPNANKFNVREYGKVLGNRNIDASTVITRLSFDVDSSVPKLLFSPVGFVSAEQFDLVKQAVASSEVTELLKITAHTVDLSNETDGDQNDGSKNEAPAAPRQEAPAAPAEPKQEAPAVPKQEEAPAKKQYRGVPEKLNGFTVNDYLNEGWTAEQLVAEGMIVEVKPEPPKAPAAPPKPKPAPAAPPKPAGPPKPAQSAAAVVEDVSKPGPASKPAAVQETTTDEDLKQLIGDLI